MRTKRTLLTISIVIILAIAMLAFVACENNTHGDEEVITAEGTTDDGFKYQIINDEYARLGPYEGELEEVVVPAKVEGKPVKHLYVKTFHTSDEGEEYWNIEQAFKTNKVITKVTLPNTLSVIREFAFYDCSNLEEVVLPDTITTIEKHAFSSCQKLGTINFPSSLKSIGKSAFSYTPIETVELPDGLEIIEENAFKGGIFEEVTIPDSVTFLGENAFAFCRDLTSVTIGEGITKISYNAFYSCHNLEVVELSASITEIGERAFSNTNLSEIVLPDNLEIIGENAFAGCASLENITIPNTIQDIGKDAFVETPWFNFSEEFFIIGDGILIGINDLDSQTTLTIPEEVKRIVVSLPQNNSIQTVNLPETLEFYGDFWAGANKLKNIYVDEENSLFKDINGVLFSKNGEILWHYPTDKGLETYAIPDGVKYIDVAQTFPGVEELIVPESICFDDEQIHSDFYQPNLDKKIYEKANIFDDSAFLFGVRSYSKLVQSHPLLLDYNYLDIQTIKFKSPKPEGVEQEEWHIQLSKSISIVWDYEE